MFRIAREGWPFVAAAAGLSGAVHMAAGPWITALPIMILLFMLFFFRDPERRIPDDDDVFVAPADGKVVLIRDVREEEHIQDDVRQISIFMSPFDVHVNRAPCAGEVRVVRHTPGGFRAAFTDEASLQNDNIAMVLDTGYGKVLVRQVAGFLARRAVCRVGPGDKLERGQRYGIIKFSSRVDLYLPKAAEVQVRTGQRVRAGETIVATISRHAGGSDTEGNGMERLEEGALQSSNS